MGPEVLSQRSRELATVPYFEPNEINPRPFLDIILILSSYLKSCSPRRLALLVTNFYSLMTHLGPLSTVSVDEDK